jgi:hypothetical protein
MNFLKKIFPVPTGPASNFYSFAVKCGRCGEVIESRVNLNNDLSVEYEGGRDVYFVRKFLMGNGLCFQQIEVELKFDASRKLLEKHVNGGKFVE